MNSAVVFDCHSHKITSYGNGTAYLVERFSKNPEELAPPQSFLVQGDEANAFYEAIWGQDVSLDYPSAIDLLYGEHFK